MFTQSDFSDPIRRPTMESRILLSSSLSDADPKATSRDELEALPAKFVTKRKQLRNEIFQLEKRIDMEMSPSMMGF